MRAKSKNILAQRADEARRAQQEALRQRDHARRMSGPERVVRYQSPAYTRFNPIKWG